MSWTLWYNERPTDHTIKYRWRLAEPRTICGKMLQPEWTDELVLCGMGYGPSEYWPEFSDWNGYVRSVPKNLEWRKMIEGESQETIYHGFNFLPCPFTGNQPKVQLYDSWVGAGPWIGRQMSISSYLVKSVGWYNANDMEKAWNTRH